MIQEQTVADIVTQDIRTATIFKKYGIDFCCGGGKKLELACSEKGVYVKNLITELELVMSKGNEELDFQTMALDELIEYIYEKHHLYIYENGPITAQFVDKVAHVHGSRHPETLEIAQTYNLLMKDLHQHMMKEERILFPYIKQMVQQSQSNGSFVNGPISVMMAEHDTAGDLLKKLNKLTSNYLPPADACNTYRASFANLKEMENDIHFHIHLENNILFPKAIELESKLAS
jgi:regulator of cell morphogenesis and NO signaling